METQQTGSVTKSFIISFYLVLVLWVVKWVEIKYGLSFANFGIIPRTYKGLIGIFTAPFIHSDLGHLLSNSFPLLITGTMLWYFFKDLAIKVSFGVYILSGLGVWLFARQAYHIGASGVLYGLAGFLFFSGFFRRDHRLLGVSFLVLFLYGGLIWGMFPIIPEISWESHLIGGIIGAAFAFFLRNKGPQRMIYPIEINEDEEEFEDEYWKIDNENEENESQQNNTAEDPHPREVL
ncbi:rhomboid family intramembrane serine protease [Solitalea canadensis]|uniref:Putative membrane protein n=1 Tax=Solitalea canadensis (strain ATCC 29591 / DSM 3403 / JCM 21819 / LMG 8368 / NBRC 15130 / NCIMB 12057 / USAM 9D) TaxID=929556 RepID=H8KUV2_SOLCM|nr:rhomboid family intramembrane serine protease [Solitalea canadensis]AFD07652.1 putative membrane protein [Solitalea canadensis DSM 3403]